MANLVRLYGERVELPLQAHQYPLTPPAARLQAGLEAYQALKLDGALHALPQAERQQVLRFLYQFGHLLFRTLFPADAFARLAPGLPLRLELQQDWSAYPWELLNDGNQWLALAWGVTRYAYPPGPAAAAPLDEPLRVLGVSAEPLPLHPDSRVGRDSAALGTRFIAPLPHLADGPGDERPAFAYRLLEHATLPALEQALGRHPHVLLFSGFATEEGWHLESDRLTGQCVPWDWLLQRVRVATQHGLRLVVLADSLGLAQPLTAVQRTRELLRAGVPAVVRIEGHVGRARRHTYLRALLAELARGTAPEAAHQTALRGLFRAYEDAWDWCTVRLYPQGVPGPGAGLPPRAAAGDAGSAGGFPVPAEPDRGPLLDAGAAPARPFESPPAPPLFRDRRRHFNRVGAQRRLLEALFPEKPAPSPLVFLTGGPGSGKTHLALELSRRVRRRFGAVLYLPERLLPPEPGEGLPVRGLPVPGQPGAEPDAEPGLPLLAALGRHLGAAPPAPGTAADTLAGCREALQQRCADGVRRLLILDRWERRPGFDALCEALLGLPPDVRVLLLTRAPPPLVPAAHVALEPLRPEELAQVCGPELERRLEPLREAGGVGQALLALCRQDLLLARLLKRAPHWPPMARLRAALAPHPAAESLAAESFDGLGADPGAGAAEGTEAGPDGPSAGEGTAPGARALLEALVDATLPGLAPDAVAVLPVLALLPWLVHRDVVGEGADLEGPRLEGALGALQRLGWADAWDGERYWALHPRLHGLLGRRLLSIGALARLQPRLSRVYRRFLAGTAGALREAPAERLRQPLALLAWDEGRAEGLPAEWVRRLHRLALEQGNLAELALLLADAAEWRALERLVRDAAPLTALRELGPVSALLHRALLLAGEQQDDPVLQADALNRIAAPLLDGGRPEQATPLLERALELLRPTAGWAALGETYRLLSRAYELQGRSEAAEGLLKSAGELAQQLGDPTLLAQVSVSLARLWSRAGAAPPEAEGFLQRQTYYLRQVGRPLEVALVRRAHAGLLFRAGRRQAAQEQLEEVLAALRELGQPGEVARTLLRLADCRLAAGDAEGAFALVGQAAAGPGAGGAGAGTLELEEQGRLLSEICRAFEHKRQLQPALEGYLRIREVLERIGDREALIGVLDHIGGLYFQLGEQDKSTQCYEERLHLQATLQPS